MNIEAKVFGGKRTGKGESEVTALSDSASGLSIVVEAYTQGEPIQRFEIFFESHRGYRALDEGDLQRYEKSETFLQPYCVYQIEKGGWANGEISEPDILNVVKALEVKEWFIATTGRCVNVLSGSIPSIKNV
jgi:hypothetical protein